MCIRDSSKSLLIGVQLSPLSVEANIPWPQVVTKSDGPLAANDMTQGRPKPLFTMLQVLPCLLYTSDAADERSSVDLGGRRIIKKKKHTNHRELRVRIINKRLT